LATTHGSATRTSAMDEKEQRRGALDRARGAFCPALRHCSLGFRPRSSFPVAGSFGFSTYGGVMNVRLAQAEDRAFVIEMARLACTLDGWPVPGAEAPGVVALLPGVADVAVIAIDDDRRVGAAWWHIHDPPLLVDTDDEPLPEIAMAVVADRRRAGIGTALVEALALQAAQRYEALTLNSICATRRWPVHANRLHGCRCRPWSLRSRDEPPCGPPCVIGTLLAPTAPAREKSLLSAL
jgi:GNAT superfamily N-acetyltransferase